MSDNTSTDDEERTTWTDERDQANIAGEKRPIPEGTRREAERRREGL